MDELRRFILESDFDPRFARAVYESLGMLEAVNINKDFLAREAGSPEKFAEARKTVQDLWKSEGMDSQLNQKTAQRVLNILYLMEIRKPGFTTADKLHSIHDLQLHNMLDTKFLNAVNSDSTPEQAEEALQNAVAHQVQQQKAYPDLTADFDMYSKRRFEKDNEYADEWKCSSSIQSLSYKMYEKRGYYQIMRSVQKLEETGVLARMCAFAARLSKALGSPSERWKGFGYRYDWSRANAVVHGIDRLKMMSDEYKKNPVPEPAGKTRKRKASDGKVA